MNKNKIFIRLKRKMQNIKNMEPKKGNIAQFNIVDNNEILFITHSSSLKTKPAIFARILINIRFKSSHGVWFSRQIPLYKYFLNGEYILCMGDAIQD